ncbi:MAG: serine protease [Candidatus Binatia bacterium]|jgi:hypothetical protein
MPTWGEIVKELTAIHAAGQLPAGTSPFDVVRRKYLQALHRHTGRNVILYASKWTQPGASPELISIGPEDMQGLMEVIHGLKGASGLDLILHSPGGSAEVAEALVTYIRSKFPSDVRVLIPQAAMSAATMLACSANSIVMGKHSFIGPIDPQFIIGGLSVPAQAILEQFKLAQGQCKDPSLLPSWLPMLNHYGPALLVQCQHALDLSFSLVSDWLRRYMFDDDPKLRRKASKIAKALRNHADFKSHNRFISRDKARVLGLRVVDLEDDQDLQDLTLSVFHATTHTFNATPAVKLIENHLGKAFIRSQQQLGMMPQIQIVPKQIPQLPVAPMPGAPPLTGQ